MHGFQAEAERRGFNDNFELLLFRIRIIIGRREEAWIGSREAR